MPHKYRIKSSGDFVYELVYSDYGAAKLDTNATGIEHKSVTLEEDGGYPFFTVPVNQLEEIYDESKGNTQQDG